jgi:hypothetical protein
MEKEREHHQTFLLSYDLDPLPPPLLVSEGEQDLRYHTEVDSKRSHYRLSKLTRDGNKDPKKTTATARLGLYHGLTSYIDTKAETLQQVFIRAYRVEIQLVMLVFSTLSPSLRFSLPSRPVPLPCVNK